MGGAYPVIQVDCLSKRTKYEYYDNGIDTGPPQREPGITLTSQYRSSPKRASICIKLVQIHQHQGPLGSVFPERSRVRFIWGVLVDQAKGHCGYLEKRKAKGGAGRRLGEEMVVGGCRKREYQNAVAHLSSTVESRIQPSSPIEPSILDER